jgi:hypothetical protein
MAFIKGHDYTIQFFFNLQCNAIALQEKIVMYNTPSLQLAIQ